MCRNSLLPTERTDFLVGGCLDPQAIGFNLEQGRKIAADGGYKVFELGALGDDCKVHISHGESFFFGERDCFFQNDGRVKVPVGWVVVRKLMTNVG